MGIDIGFLENNFGNAINTASESFSKAKDSFSSIFGNLGTNQSGQSYTYTKIDENGNPDPDQGFAFCQKTMNDLDPDKKDGKLTVDEVNRLGKVIDGKTLNLDDNDFISPGEDYILAVAQDTKMGTQKADGTVTPDEAAYADNKCWNDRDGFKKYLTDLYNTPGANGTPSIAQKDQEYIKKATA